MVDTLSEPSAEFIPLPAQDLDADRQLLADLHVVPTLVYSEDPMRQHALRAKQYPRLELEQEIRLAQIMEHGRKASERLTGESLEAVQPDDITRFELGGTARGQLINSNLLLVINVANSFRYELYSKRLDPVDLVLEGNMAMLRIVDRYDWRQGPFVSYAGQALRRMMRKHIKKFGGAMSVPHTRDIAYSSDSNNGIEPGEYELAAGRAFGADSLEDMPLDTPGNGDTEGDAIESWEMGVVRTLLAGMPQRERHIVIRKFALDGGEEASQSQIGDEIGISQMHVSRLLRRALGSLANHPSLSDQEQVASDSHTVLTRQQR